MPAVAKGASSDRFLTASAAWDRFWTACLAVAPEVLRELTGLTSGVTPFHVGTLEGGERLLLVEVAWASNDAKNPVEDLWSASLRGKEFPRIEIFGTKAGRERLRALVVEVGKWQRKHALFRPDNLPNLHCMERALKMIQHPFVFPDAVERPLPIILEQMDARFPGSTALPFHLEAARLWEGESEDHCRRRLKRKFAEALNLHFVLVRRVAAQSGVQVRRNLEHFVWFAHWQLLGWNAARIHAKLAPGGTDKVKRHTPSGIKFVSGYPHVHNALTRVATLLNLKRRRGRPGR